MTFPQGPSLALNVRFLPVKVVSWNVNSVNARLARVVSYLERTKPDVLMLQEIKCQDEKFPSEIFKNLGYQHQAVFGQKTYNGVAFLSLHPIQNIQRSMGDGVEDPQARVLQAQVNGLTLIDVYVPNGQELGSEKFAYKIAWLRRLRAYFDKNLDPDSKVLIAGDFNIALDERDVYDPVRYVDHIHFTKEERDNLAYFLEFGLVDTFRLHHQEAGLYSWWDYRELSFPLNKGLRIDYVYVTDALAEKCVASGIDRDERKGEKPSDHAPVWAEFSL